MKKPKSLLAIFAIILSISLYTSSTMAQNYVTLQTSAGDIKIMLYNETVKHKENFLKLVKEGYYDGLLFHRVISNFMIQGGDPNSRNAKPGQNLGDGGPGYTIPAEFLPQYFHKKGALAAARQGDQVNPKKASSGSQFYIVQGQKLSSSQLNSLVSSNRHVPFTPEQQEAYTTLGGTPHLDNAYTVFGEVVEGLEVIDQIAAAQTDPSNRPLTDIRIIKAVVSE